MTHHTLSKKQNHPKTYAELKYCAEAGMTMAETSLYINIRIGLVRKWAALYPFELEFRK